MASEGCCDVWMALDSFTNVKGIITTWWTEISTVIGWCEVKVETLLCISCGFVIQILARIIISEDISNSHKTATSWCETMAYSAEEINIFVNHIVYVDCTRGCITYLYRTTVGLR